jgi:hypothetical protein
MYAPTGTFTPPTPPRIPPRSFLMRLLVRSVSYRHPQVMIRVRLACAIWNLALGVVLLVSSYWLGQFAWWGLVPLAGSALLFMTVAHLRRFIQSELTSDASRPAGGRGLTP